MNCADLPQWLQWATIVAILLVEAWLGRTNKVKSSSLVELFITIIAAVIVRLLTKRSDNGKSI